MCTSNAVSNKELYPTFARTIFGDNSIAPSVLAMMDYFKWDVVGIISEDDKDWKLRGEFMESYLNSQGKTVAVNKKVRYNWAYTEKDDGGHYQDILRTMKTKARSKYFRLFKISRLVKKQTNKQTKTKQNKTKTTEN